MGISKTSDSIQIKVKMLNPSQEPPASSKALNEDLKDIDVLCTLKIKIENQDSDYGYMKTSYHIQINIKIPNPSQEPPVSSKALNEDLKDIDALCTFKIKIESQNLYHGYIKDQQPYPNQDQVANSQSGTSSIIQSLKQVLKG